MKAAKVQIIIILALSLLWVSTTMAAETTIKGNPIGRRNDYTINGPSAENVTVTCQFNNTGQVPAKLNIWTSPESSKPTTTIVLQPASLSKKVVTISKSFKLSLKSLWWCKIYIRRDANKWKYCSYLSVSDATISDTKPFATWNKTIHSRKTTYNCSVKSKNNSAAFFYYR